MGELQILNCNYNCQRTRRKQKQRFKRKICLKGRTGKLFPFRNDFHSKFKILSQNCDQKAKKVSLHFSFFLKILIFS